jgi:hypothetical protein
VFSERDARRVLMDGVGGVAKGDDRHGQCENGLEVEPALHVLGRGAGRDGFGNSVRSGRLLSAGFYRGRPIVAGCRCERTTGDGLLAMVGVSEKHEEAPLVKASATARAWRNRPLTAATPVRSGRGRQ